MAKEDNLVRSTTTGELSSPAISNSATSNLGTDARRIAADVKSRVLESSSGSSDYAYKQGLEDLGSQISQLRGQKELSNLGALGSIGSLRQQIFDNETERRQASAESGFLGQGQQLRQGRQFARQIGQSESDLESNYLNSLRSQNLNIGNIQDQELAKLRGTEAFSAEVAEEIANRQLSGQAEGNLFDMETDTGWFGRTIGGLVGKDVDFSARLQTDEFQKSTYFRNLLSELGVNIDNVDLNDAVAKALKKEVSATAKRGALWTGTGESSADYETDLKRAGKTVGSVDVGRTTSGAKRAILENLRNRN